MLTIYKASAGSGKTYTLALRYLTALLGIKLRKTESADAQAQYVLNSAKYSPDHHRHPGKHRHILAITFTNKATAEMKSRILAELHSLGVLPKDGEKDAEYAGTLVKTFGCTRPELATAAKLAERELLSDFGSFNVSTIDSFFQTVLRTFAREVDHQGDYAIELEDKEAVKAGVGLMLDDLKYGDAPEMDRMQRWVDNFTAGAIADGRGALNIFDTGGSVRESLSDFVRHMCREPFRRRAAEMEEYFRSGKLQELRKELHKAAKKIPETRRRMALEFSRQWSDAGHTGEQIKFGLAKIVAAWSAGDDIKVNFDTKGAQNLLNWRPGMELDNLFTKTKLPKSGKSVLWPSQTFATTIQNQLIAIREEIRLEQLIAWLNDACANLEFLSFAEEYIGRYRRENNLILLSDTNELLRRIIKDSEVPFIYERMGLQLETLLIDEFQDTSKMQWSNLKPLVSNSLAGGHESLIIGDVKQAIYRFRNSDSSMLDHSVQNEDYPGRYRLRGTVPEENTNWRSSHTVVRFNNSLFYSMARVLGVPAYDSVEQALSPRKKDLSGYVHIEFHPKEENPDILLDAMCRDILRQHDSGYRWKDIAILLRTHNPLDGMVHFILKNYPQIPIVSDEALLLRSSTAVQLIVSLMRLVEESWQPGPASATLKPGEYLSRSEERRDVGLMISRFNYFLSHGLDVPQALEEALSAKDEDLAGLSDDLHNVMLQQPANLTALVEVIIAQKVPVDLRRNEFAYISAFQDMLAEYMETHSPSLRDFLRFWDDYNTFLAVSGSPDADAVSILTIHKSKGLEWDCVHLPYASDALSKSDNLLWLDVRNALKRYMPGLETLAPPLIMMEGRTDMGAEGSPLEAEYNRDRREQQADALNNYYVAFTRAGRELIVRCAGYEKSNTTGELLHQILSTGTHPDANPELGLSLNLTVDPESGREIFEAGSPTVSEKHKESRSTNQTSPDYFVTFRNDTRELTSVENVLNVGLTDIGVEEEKEITDSPDRDDITDPATIEKMRRAARRGTMLHNILANMRVLDDMTRCINAVARFESIDADERAACTQILRSAFEAADERVMRWFSPEVRVMNERELTNPHAAEESSNGGKGRTEILRPDRLVFYKDGSIEVVDYKFTSHPGKAHRDQVREYVRLLREVYPGRPVRGTLWYPALHHVIPVVE